MRARSPLAALLLALPVTALAQWTSGIHDTGVVRFEVFDNGKLGAFFDGDDGAIGTGFVFDGEQGLFEGAFLVGAGPGHVTGGIGDFPDLEWAAASPVTPQYHPIFGVDGYEAVYADASQNPPGLTVTQFSYSRVDNAEPFVFVEFTLENTSGEALSGLHAGVFADWNVGASDANLCAYDDGTQLLYVWDATGASDDYFGVVAVNEPMDVTVTGISYDARPGDASLYDGLTVAQPDCEAPRDVRAILGVGPYDLDAGERVAVTFALVGGASEGEILNNAEIAQGGFGCFPPCPAAEPSADDRGVALHAVSPNPARGTAALTFTLERPQPIRLSIHDVLGREVAVLADGVRAAGDHAVAWEAARLPAGFYLARLTAGSTTQTRPVTLLR
jgi:hypothetical protein